VSLLTSERLRLAVTWRESLSIEETYNRYDHKWRPEKAAAHMVIVVNNFISFQA
jgi:hypothetical protein